jgi:hypothetical protein
MLQFFIQTWRQTTLKIYISLESYKFDINFKFYVSLTVLPWERQSSKKHWPVSRTVNDLFYGCPWCPNGVKYIDFILIVCVCFSPET